MVESFLGDRVGHSNLCEALDFRLAKGGQIIEVSLHIVHNSWYTYAVQTMHELQFLSPEPSFEYAFVFVSLSTTLNLSICCAGKKWGEAE